MQDLVGSGFGKRGKSKTLAKRSYTNMQLNLTLQLWFHFFSAADQTSYRRFRRLRNGSLLHKELYSPDSLADGKTLFYNYNLPLLP